MNSELARADPGNRVRVSERGHSRAGRDASPEELADGSAAEGAVSQVVLLASLGVGIALRLWLAFSDDGVHWPDEIYQTLEPAHRAAFGYGLLAWEFLEGARSWALPGLIAGLLKLTQVVGLDSPRAYLTVVRILFCAVGVATSVVVYRFARSSGASRLAASCGSACFSLMSIAIYFAPRAMSETSAALAAALGLFLSLPSNASRAQLWLGASFLGLAVLFRLQCAVFCIGLLIVLLARGDRRPFAEALLVLGLWAFLFGLIDRLTWGQWFHSAIVYLRFNVFQGGSVRFGRSPPGYFTLALLHTVGPLWPVIAGLSILAVRRTRALFGIALLFFIPHWVSPHKELRFLAPLIPLWCVLAAVGLQVLMDAKARWIRVGGPALVLTAAAYSAATFRQLTYAKFGLSQIHVVSALDAGGPENRLLIAAHDAADLCGLKVMSQELDYLGGFSYLHRPVPLYGPAGPPEESRHFNYVIAARGTVAGSVLAEDSGLVLALIFEGRCQPDRSYNWHLN
ncbi:MAG TPA: hypothetical protein VFV14_09385 [Myxococcaceae bacterium]|nr:hypothetical protein [Myxococcaceae bacterium]